MLALEGKEGVRERGAFHEIEYVPKKRQCICMCV